MSLRFLSQKAELKSAEIKFYKNLNAPLPYNEVGDGKRQEDPSQRAAGRRVKARSNVQ